MTCEQRINDLVVTVDLAEGGTDRTFEAVVIDWDATMAGAPSGVVATVRRRVEALCAVTVDVAAVSGAPLIDVDGRLRARPVGPGRLLLSVAGAAELYEVTSAGPRPLDDRAVPAHEPASRNSVMDRFAERGIGPGLVLVIGAPGTDGTSRLLGLLDEQLRRRRHRRVPSVDDDPAWTIRSVGPDPAQDRATATRFTLGAAGFATTGSWKRPRTAASCSQLGSTAAKDPPSISLPRRCGRASTSTPYRPLTSAFSTCVAASCYVKDRTVSTVAFAASRQCRSAGCCRHARRDRRQPPADRLIPTDLIDYAIDVAAPLPSPSALPPDETSRQIGEQVAARITDGSTLQLGIGAIPDAALRALTGRRGLRIWSEMISDGVLALERGGSLDVTVPVTASRWTSTGRSTRLASKDASTRASAGWCNDGTFVPVMQRVTCGVLVPWPPTPPIWTSPPCSSRRTAARTAAVWGFGPCWGRTR